MEKQKTVDTYDYSTSADHNRYDRAATSRYPVPHAPPMDDENHNAPSYAIPVYQDNQPPYGQYQPSYQYQHQQHQPLRPNVYIPPAYSRDYRSHGWIGSTLKLAIFHLLNAILGITAFAVVVTGTSVSIGLIPACCIGLCFFRAVLFIVGYLAELDVSLYNYISPPDEHVYVGIPHQAHVFGLSGQRLSPRLSSFSPLALVATLYFVTIKFMLAIASCIAVSMFLSLPTALIYALSDDHVADSVGFFGDDEDSRVTLSNDPLGFVIIWCSLFVISIALMHVVAILSRKATRVFCCEKFSTYHYIRTMQPPAADGPASSYGATGVY